MTKENEPLDIMFGRIQANIESLGEERNQWLKARRKKSNLMKAITEIKALVTKKE